MLRRHQSPCRRWPFWLLLAGWVCANSPQAATFELILWLKGAEHFSHQAKLRQSVANLLAGPSHESAQQVAAMPTTPRPAEPPMGPVEGAELKKIDLATGEEETGLLLPDQTLVWPRENFAAPPACVADVPHTPPRSAA